MKNWNWGLIGAVIFSVACWVAAFWFSFKV
ncbi:hypothetical protein EV294_101354 [Paenibacillus sp. BK033]|nr:hypothetical protein EV294_101354 [Paenibacillus sp. BK033]